MSATVTLSVPGTPAGVSQAQEAARAWSLGEALSVAIRDRLLTVLDEVLTNVVRHGFRGRAGAIVVDLRCRDGLLEARVADDAGPFNPLLVPLPDTSRPLEARVPGGLGIMLVRALVDEVRYERASDRNHLTMTWYLGTRGAAGQGGSVRGS